MTARGRGRLAGLTAVVVGASRGIGRSIASRLAADGARPICGGRSADGLRETVAAIEAAGGSATAHVMDVTDDEGVASFCQTVLEDAGAPDILVYNAGILRVGAFVDTDLSTWQSVMDTNLMGAVRVTGQLLPGMLERGSGRVIFIASTAGKYGSPMQASYNASKHALVGLTRCLALETAAAGVRVNAICPGFVGTEMIAENLGAISASLGIPTDEVVPTLLSRVPIGRMVDPDEVAELTAYLAAPAADAMTGQAITLAGGFLLI